MIHHGGFDYILFQITAVADLELSGGAKDWWKKVKIIRKCRLQVDIFCYWFYSIFGWMVDLWMCTFWFPKLFDRLVWLFSVSIIQHNFDLKKIEAIPPIVYNDGYLHKKVRGKTSSLVALCHYMCLYARNSWEKEAIFNTVLFQETEHWNSNLPSWLGYFGYQQAAGYPKTQFSLYVVKIFPTLYVT